MGRIATIIVVVLALVSVGTDAQESIGTPTEDIAIVMDEGFPFAETMLREKSELFPFVVVMAADGQIKLVVVQPPSKNSLDNVLEHLRESARDGQHRAVAIFSGVRKLHPKSNKKEDMVGVGFEHVTGHCGNMFFPYTLPLEKIDRDEVLLTDRNGKVFSKCN